MPPIDRDAARTRPPAKPGTAELPGRPAVTA